MIETRKHENGILIVQIGRVLDNNNAHEVMQVVDAALKAGNRAVVFDMSEVEFLSSAGVGSLISSISTLRNNEGAMTLFGLSDKILHVFQVLDLCDYMPIETDFDQAAARCFSLLQGVKST